MKKNSFPRSKIEILLLEAIHPVAKEILEAEGFQVQIEKAALSEAELIKRAKDVHILGIRSKTQITKKFLAEQTRLMSIGCFCIGTNQVEVEEARKRGVSVFNAPFSNTRSVAEMVLAEIVGLSRRLFDRSAKLHQGDWDKSAADCFEVRGKTLGIVGYGHIGSQVSVLAESFGMRVLYYDILTKMAMGNSKQVSKLAELLKESDFVTLHVPETPETKNMMGAQELKQMKKGSHLINASRGTVVDIKALKKALVEKHLLGAAIDVFPLEPESNNEKFVSELQGVGNVILTPHIGGSTEEAQKNIGIEVASALTKFVNNGSTTGAVNFPQIDLPIQRGNHRILNVHKNVPGVLASINKILSDLGANIQAQYLGTDAEIGYMIVEIDQKVSEQAKEQIKKMPTSIRTRILY